VPGLAGQVDVTGGVPALGPVGSEADGTRIDLAEDQHADRPDVGVDRPAEQ
jgi:hypothetical protein